MDSGGESLQRILKKNNLLSKILFIFIFMSILFLAKNAVYAQLVNNGTDGTVSFDGFTTGEILVKTTASDSNITICNLASSGFDFIGYNGTGSTATIRSNATSNGSVGSYIKFFGVGTVGSGNIGAVKYLEARANSGIFDLNSIALMTNDTNSASSGTATYFDVQALDATFNPVGNPIRQSLNVASWSTLDASGNSDFKGIGGIRITPGVGVVVCVDEISINNSRTVQDSTISPVDASFNKVSTSTDYKDIPVTMTINGYGLSSITNGVSILSLGTDYTVSGNLVTIKKEYLKTLSTGTSTLNFNFSGGNVQTQPLSVNVTDSTNYIVTYNGNGSTGGSVPSDINAYPLNASATAAAAGSLVRDNYTFTGWNTAVNGSGTSIAAGGSFVITGNTTLYAQWAENPKFTVTYDGNGAAGSVPVDAVQHYVNTPVTASEAGSLSKAPHHHFTGWNTATDGSGISVLAGASFPITANTTLYAQWAEDSKYTVNYDGNGSDNGRGLVGYYDYVNTSVIVASAGIFGRTHFSFAGWNTEANGSGTPVAAGGGFVITGDTTLYAQWIEDSKFTITYNGNGNTGGTAPAEASYYIGEPSAISGAGSLVKENYTFTGWNTAVDGSGTAYAAGANFSATVNTILYSQWVENPKYTVSYNGNGNTTGAVPVDPDNHYENTSVTAAGAGSLSKTPHYHFTGWNTSADGSGISVLAGASFPITANTTLYAQWSEDSKYTVTYNGNNNDAGGVPIDTGSYYVNTSVTTAGAGSLGRSHFSFAGWNTALNGSGTAYAAGGSFNITGNTTLYAQWTENSKFTITYNGNGNTGGTAPAEASYYIGESATISGVGSLVKDNYTFTGWNTAADGSGTAYAAGANFPATANTILYAQWIENPKYTVSYNGNGNTTGTVPVDPGNRYVNTSVTAAGAGSLSKTSYTFAGWNTAADGIGTTIAAGGSFVITGNITLYAQWTSTYTPPTPPPPGPTQPEATGTVIDPITGKEVEGIKITVITEADGTKAIAFKSQEAIVFRKLNGTISPLGNNSRMGFTATGKSNAAISSDGTINIKKLAPGTETKIYVTFDLGFGLKLTIGTIDVKVSNSGQVALTSTLIDPYGTITDSATGKAIQGANVTLYYANTDRNKAAGKTPDAVVQLPAITGFEPNDNANPQLSDVSGAYAFMVYPTTDYYLVSAKEGYDKYVSPTISVEQEIVKHDFKMNKSVPTSQDSTISPNAVSFDKNVAKQADASTDLSLNGNTLVSITNGTKVIVNGTDYTTTSGVVVIKKEYLAAQSTGTTTLTFNFSAGNTQTLAITVKDTTVSSSGGSGGSSGSAATPTPTLTKISVERIAGQNRVDTALAIAKAAYKDKVSKVIIASSDNYPDALAGSVLSYNLKAPILLVGSSNEDQEKIIAYMKENMNSLGTVYILGGNASIGTDMEAKVNAAGFKNVNRLGGKDRYETAVKIADTIGVKEGTPIVIVSGENYPDAISISSIAAAKQYPILMVNKDEMSDIVKKEISSIKPTKVYIIGLQGAVSTAVENQVAQTAAMDKANIVRIGGANRFETSLNVAKYFSSSAEKVCVASGNNFPDALAGSSYAANNNAPIVLVDNSLNDDEKSFIKNLKLTEISIFGGAGAVPTEVQNQISELINK
jgi:uncharacterized repeat protein (TIGR02543 family)